jgi:hypothetical protein
MKTKVQIFFHGFGVRGIAMERSAIRERPIFLEDTQEVFIGVTAVDDHGQIEFHGQLDEAFGVAANKQGVRLKGYVQDAIKEALGGDVTTINDEIKRFQGQLASQRVAAKPTASEARHFFVKSSLESGSRALPVV